MNLHAGFRAAGDDATLAVGFRRTGEPGVVVLDNEGARGFRGKFEHAVQRTISRVPAIAPGFLRRAPLFAQPRRLYALFRGYEDFWMPASARVLELTRQPPDVVHCHNLHGGYFDLRQLAAISNAVPTFLTLHDMWTLTGHCAYSLGCERWRSGCGSCPDLTIYPAVARDGTRHNLALKRDVYRRSKLRVASPSQWLLDKARASVLAEGTVEWRLIPYGVDLDTFNPAGRDTARQRLDLSQDALVLLYAANVGSANPFKDYSTAAEAARRISEARLDREFVFLVLGGAAGVANTSGTRFVPYVSDRAALADYYRAADLFLHAAREDNFPNTVLESQACGTPVIATAVGGISEQIAHGTTGFVVPAAGASEMAQAVLTLSRDHPKLAVMRRAAEERARELYDLRRHVAEYRSWFSSSILA